MSLYKDLMDMVLDESTGSKPKDKIEAEVSRLCQHMLKFQFEQNKQTRSWITTICDASKELDTLSNNTVAYNLAKSKIDDEYNNGKKEMIKEYQKANHTKSETINLEKQIPDRFEDWTIDNLRNKKFIIDYMNKYAFTDEAKKELEGKKYK